MLFEAAGFHPQPLDDMVRLLWSINERMAGREGLDVPEPTDDYVQEVVEMVKLRRTPAQVLAERLTAMESQARAQQSALSQVLEVLRRRH